MVINLSQYLKETDGYTLLETVVAMAIFLGVLIPLGMIIGGFLFDKTPDHMRYALILAQTEMSRVISEENYIEDKKKIGDQYLIERKIDRVGNIINVMITVRLLKDKNSKILAISKSILNYK